MSWRSKRSPADWEDDHIVNVVLGPRHERVLEGLVQRQLDAVVVHDAANLRWSTGFRGSTAMAVLSHGRWVLIVDGRYADGARSDVDGLADAGLGIEVVEIRTGAQRLEAMTAACGSAKRVGFITEVVTVAEHQRWRQHLRGELVPVEGLFEQARRMKDDSELAAIAEACRIADAALAQVTPLLAHRVTEVDVRDELEYRMRRLGAEAPSYPTIVATGPVHGARPHHQPTSVAIEEGHTVVIDVGALVDGYHSDMTRTFVVGEPTPLQAEWYGVVAAAQRAALEVIAPGVGVGELDRACRRVIDDAGLGAWFTHGSSHGVGLDIHEQPFSTPSTAASGDVFLAGDVVTVEPGVYRGDLGGVRIEDLVVLVPGGHRQLTASPKDTPCLPSPPTI
jgi:Xaa-Pro aminopeptidase